MSDSDKKEDKYCMMIDYLVDMQDDIFELARIDCCEVSMIFNKKYIKEHCWKINTNVFGTI